MIVTVILILLCVLGSAFLATLLHAARRRGQLRPSLEAIGLGAVTNFFDTLGIGSFAPTTAWLKLRRCVPDSFLPATLNSGHALPTVVQAVVFIHLVRVDPWLLCGCIAAAVCGAALGARWVVRVPVRVVQGVVGVAMLLAAALYALANLKLMPAGGQALGLDGAGFAVAVSAHLMLGALMSFGIGLYAPSLILLSLLGLEPTAAFPVMMGACAFLMPVSGMRFVRSARIDLRVVLGLALGGIPAVVLAAFVVRSLTLENLRWGVVVVVLYAAIALLRSALRAPSPVPAPDLIRPST
ncbi:TSUP family transporter [Agrilutibacter solisilvae]|uniref:TSUP family transporter n=1 Tax=Agrilutibacter solisilvae TaxID=2763317 RepID=A0A974Y684_9GAMM|nr:TSUP family transporter [Lysobacter solisilvae]QSX79441.1 TSUP family transporter [Lysobacter solisilvae]